MTTIILLAISILALRQVTAGWLKHHQIIESDSLKSQIELAGNDVIINCNLLSNFYPYNDDIFWIIWKNGLEEDLIERIIEGKYYPKFAFQKVTDVPKELYQSTNEGSRLTLPGNMTSQRANERMDITCIAQVNNTYDFASMDLLLLGMNATVISVANTTSSYKFEGFKLGHIIEDDVLESQTQYAGYDITIDCNLLQTSYGEPYIEWLMWRNDLEEDLLKKVMQNEIDPKLVIHKVVQLPKSYYQTTQVRSRIIVPGNLTMQKAGQTIYITCLAKAEYPYIYDFASIKLKIVDETEPIIENKRKRILAGGKVCPTKEWMLQESNFCFGPGNEEHGKFKMQNNGILKGLKFVHSVGSISCGKGSSSYWGCGGKHVSIVVTDNDNLIIMPDFLSASGWFVLPGYNSHSKELVLIDDERPMYAYEGQLIKVWGGEGYKQQISSSMGRVCADVYALLD